MSYHLNPNRRCHVCWRFGLDPEHLKSCVPRRYWPVEELRQRSAEALSSITPDERAALTGALAGEWVSHILTETAAGEQSITVTATAEGEESPRVSAVICDCGYMAKTASGLRLHRMKAKQHQKEAAAGTGVQLTDAGGRLRSSSPRVTSDYDAIVPLPNGEFLPEAS